ncbi:hypothetical protein EU803_16155 [Loktanella sp. IMCC34160]|uniref:hypothetical protein n=1 Tax=Loktanella sp. IMCC34160 TaxID=2510646 RepID=UPI00101C00DB|nr:hypothetical protein [Loktanella sp. IMCC34160]RYG89686.1 hypothetical protein EU803_16155 [Loktanella sp. IMCC34160]
MNLDNVQNTEVLFQRFLGCDVSTLVGIFFIGPDGKLDNEAMSVGVEVKGQALTTLASNDVGSFKEWPTIDELIRVPEIGAWVLGPLTLHTGLEDLPKTRVEKISVVREKSCQEVRMQTECGGFLAVRSEDGFCFLRWAKP